MCIRSCSVPLVQPHPWLPTSLTVRAEVSVVAYETLHHLSPVPLWSHLILLTAPVWSLGYSSNIPRMLRSSDPPALLCGMLFLGYSLGFIPPPSSNIFSKPPGQMCNHLSQSTLLYYIFSINLTTFLHYFNVFIVCFQLEYKLLEDGNLVCFMHCCIPVAGIVPPQFIFTDWTGA